MSLLDLRGVKTKQDLFALKPRPENFRGEWLVGFGWDSNLFVGDFSPDISDLDKSFPDFPVFFYRADGHACWVNSKALSKAAFLTPQRSGVYLEHDKENLKTLLPAPSRTELMRQALMAQDFFLSQGFQDLRDVGSQISEWEVLFELKRTIRLNLNLLLNYECHDLHQFRKTLSWLIEIRKQNQDVVKGATGNLVPAGIKIYYDGSLGSETALVSKPYRDSQNFGVRLWRTLEIATVMRETWQAGFQLSVHSLGDLAVHEVLEIAKTVRDAGIRGILNLEHVELCQERSLPLLQSVRPICHFQPSHFLQDQIWLKNKVGHLETLVFPWRWMEDHGIRFYFGSDSPIAIPNLERTELAIREASANGIPAPHKASVEYHRLNESLVL